MSMKSGFKKFLVFFLAILFVLTSIGFLKYNNVRSANQKNVASTNANIVQNSGNNNPEQDKKLAQDINKKLTGIFKDSKSVLNAETNVRNNEIIGMVTIADGVKKDDAMKLGNDYLSKLKGESGGKKVSVQVWQNGSNIGNLQ